MIPAEVIERARDAALVDASRVETRLTMGSVDAALRSVLTDLRAESVFLGFPDTAASGWECAQPVIDDLLRELGDG